MKYTLFVFSLLVFLVLPTMVQADDAATETISLRPATIALTIEAGEVMLQTMYFTNQSDQHKSFTVLRSDYSLDSTDSKALTFLDPNTTTDSVHTILDVVPLNFELDGGQTQELLVRIRPDGSVRPGQYKGALFVGQTQQAADSTSIQVVGRVGAIIGVTVTGASSGLTASTRLPFPGRPSAVVVAFVLFVVFAFLGIALAAIRTAREARRNRQLY